jgi:hypothetical protein
MKTPTAIERNVFFSLLGTLTGWLFFLSFYPYYFSNNYVSAAGQVFNVHGIYFFLFWGDIVGLIALSIYGAVRMDPYNVSRYPHFYLLISLVTIFFALIISSTAGSYSGGTVNFYLFFPAVFIMLGLAVYGMRMTTKTNKRLRQQQNKTDVVNSNLEEKDDENGNTKNEIDTKNYIGGRRTGLTFALSIIIGGITGGVVDTYLIVLFPFLFILFIATAIALMRKHGEINQALYITLVFLSCMAIPLFSGLILYAIARHKKLTR